MSLLRVSNRPCAQVWCGREATGVGRRKTSIQIHKAHTPAHRQARVEKTDDLSRERGDGGDKQERTRTGRQGRPLPVVAAAQQRFYLDARWHVGCWPCPPQLYLTSTHSNTRQHTAKGQTQVRHVAKLQSGALETHHSRPASRAPPGCPRPPARGQRRLASPTARPPILGTLRCLDYRLILVCGRASFRITGLLPRRELRGV